jgi:hypothetical protein
MMRLVTSQRYRGLWGDRFGMLKVGEQKIENDQTGWNCATSLFAGFHSKIVKEFRERILNREYVADDRLELGRCS